MLRINITNSFHRTSFVMMIIMGMLSGCNQKNVMPEKVTHDVNIDRTVQLTEAQHKFAGIELSPLEKKKVNQVLSLNGKVEVMPENVISVSSPASGFIRNLRWIPGMSVGKGQLLVLLEEKEFIQLQQDYLTAKSAYYYAKLDYERQKELNQNQASSDKILQQAEEKMRQQQILVSSLAEKLRLIHINPGSLQAENLTSQIKISAPISGTITEVLINNGKYVQAGEELFRMLNSTAPRLVLKAFDKDVALLSPGQTFVAFTNANPDIQIGGKIDYIVKQINSEGYTQIIGTLNKTSVRIIPGMYMNAEINVQNMDSWTLPDEALVHFEGKDYIFVEAGKQSYVMEEVKTGKKENGVLLIQNPEAFQNKKIVIKGAYTLLMKLKNIES